MTFLIGGLMFSLRAGSTIAFSRSALSTMEVEGSVRIQNLAIRWALVSFPPFFQMGTRFLAAGALLMAWVLWRGKNAAPLPTALEWRNALVVGTLMLGGGMGLTASAERHPGTAGFASEMLCGGAVLMGVSLALGEQPAASPQPLAVAAWLYLVVFGSLIAFSAYLYLGAWAAEQRACVGSARGRRLGAGAGQAWTA